MASKSCSGLGTQPAPGSRTREVRTPTQHQPSHLPCQPHTSRASLASKYIHTQHQYSARQGQGSCFGVKPDGALRHVPAGEVHGRFLPQSVSNKEGQPQDVDIIVNEILSDGDEVFVEYGNGPTAYRVRCVISLLLQYVAFTRGPTSTGLERTRPETSNAHRKIGRGVHTSTKRHAACTPSTNVFSHQGAQGAHCCSRNLHVVVTAPAVDTWRCQSRKVCSQGGQVEKRCACCGPRDA